MTTKRFFLTAMSVLVLLAFTAPTFAQRVGDRDGDGLPDNTDKCPDQAGPRENGGCPLPGDTTSNGNDTPDRDGDGVPDYVDNCPDQPGTGFTEGCPDDLAGDTSSPDQPIILGSVPNPAQAPFTWGSMSQCMVGLFPTAPTTVRIREKPTTSAPTIGQLLPGQQFAPFTRAYDDNGSLWFGGAPAGDGWGWVFAGVVANNGQCDGLPMVVPLGTPFRFDIKLAFDPFPDSIPHFTHTLEDIIIVDPQPVINDETDPPADVEQVIEGSVPTVEVHVQFDMFLQDGTPLRAKPLLFLKPIDPNAPEDCADIGEGMCLVMGMLLPAFGNEPGQCPPQMMMDSLQTAFPGEPASDDPHKQWVVIVSDQPIFNGDFNGDGVVDTTDYTVWQDGLDSTSLLQLAEALVQGASHNTDAAGAGAAIVNGLLRDDNNSADSPPDDHEDEIVIHGASWNMSCAVVGFTPGGEDMVLGDGSVHPGVQTTAMLLPAIASCCESSGNEGTQRHS